MSRGDRSISKHLCTKKYQERVSTDSKLSFRVYTDRYRNSDHTHQRSASRLYHVCVCMCVCVRLCVCVFAYVYMCLHRFPSVELPQGM